MCARNAKATIGQNNWPEVSTDVKAGLAAAQIENVVLWAALATVDRVHPNRRTGAWPPFVRNPRSAVYEVICHARFGAVPGALVRR